jgi:hypothetical protein
VSVPIGDASNGLCGGMAFAARDYFEADRTPPPESAAPGDGPLFDYLVDRLFDSFDLPLGPMRYLQLMSPAMPDGDSVLTRFGLAPHGRAWRTVAQEWPKVRADLDAGHPSPLGLVRIRSTNPIDLKQNHQVLAYGYDLEGTALTLRVYDPNWPGRDDVTFSLDVGAPPRPVLVTPRPPGPPVFAFFRVGYDPVTPP